MERRPWQGGKGEGGRGRGGGKRLRNAHPEEGGVFSVGESRENRSSSRLVVGHPLKQTETAAVGARSILEEGADARAHACWCE